MSRFWRPLENLSSWRKISVGMWETPRDPTIYGHELLDVTEALRYLDAVSEACGERVSMTALVVKAFAAAYENFPELNVMIVNGRIQKRESIDVFCQVAIPNESTSQADLSGVKLVGANDVDLVALSRLLQGRAQKVRDGEDAEMEQTKAVVDRVPPWLMGGMLRAVDFLTFNVPTDLDAIGVRSDPFGSFMVSSVAGFDIKLGYAPLVPASRCPMVVLPGVVHDAVLPVNGEPVVRPAMYVGVTFDHRCFDGYQIGYIVRTTRNLITDPFAHWPEPAYWADEEGEARHARTARAG